MNKLNCVLVQAGLLASACVIAWDQWSRGYPIGAVIFAGLILAGGLSWLIRSRTAGTDRGVDPWVFMWLAVAVASLHG